MKIQREVNGQVLEFELTPDELFEAYEEQEYLYDLQAVKDKLEEWDPDDFEEEYGVSKDLVMANQDLLDEMACLSRQSQDEDGLDWYCARDDAVDEVLEKHKDELVATAKEKEQDAREVKVHEGLPEFCYSTLEHTGTLIIIERGEVGYRKAADSSDYAPDNREMADAYNRRLGVTKAQESAMFVGSLFGWHVPAANPEMYDEYGKLKKQFHSLEDQIGAAEQLKGSPPSIERKEKVLDDR